MLELPIEEIIVFAFAVTVYLAAAIIGILQLLTGGEKYRRFLSSLVVLAVVLEVVILILRAVEIKAVPLTGLFESMITLTVVFGLVYLFFSIVIEAVWFGSVMAWVIFSMILLAGIAAEPASEPEAVAATPWAIAHGVAMVLGGVSIMFATASAFLYLLGSHRLKRKKVIQVLGRVPNLEKLERMNLLGLKACLVLMTFGVVTGIGMAAAGSAALEMTFLDWLTDAKVVLVLVAWMLICIILALWRASALKGKMIAYMTIVAFVVLVLFAIVVSTVFCGTKHDFVRDDVKAIEVRR